MSGAGNSRRGQSLPEHSVTRNDRGVLITDRGGGGGGLSLPATQMEKEDVRQFSGM